MVLLYLLPRVRGMINRVLASLAAVAATVAPVGHTTPSPLWQLQSTTDCVEQASRVALAETGHKPPAQAKIDAYATAQGFLTPSGTVDSPAAWVTLVRHYGGAASVAPMSRARLDRELKAKEAVVAIVNAETYWSPIGYRTDAPTTSPDHAVTIEGDGPRGVTLIDTGIPAGNGLTVPWATFTRAWSVSGYQAMTVPPEV